MAEEVYVSWETGGEDANIIGDASGVELREAVRFTAAANITCTSASIYVVMKNRTPEGPIIFRIETSVDNKPSGTLAHANATGEVAFVDITIDAWNKATFTKFALPAGTYWLVLKLEPGQGRNDFWGILCTFDGVGWGGQWDDMGMEWYIEENLYIDYFRIYREVVVGSKFRDEICFKGLPGGTSIRGQVNKEFIYAVKNRQQRKYAYFIPTNPQTAPQQAWRAKFTAGIAAAKLLSEAEIAAYKKTAYRKKGQTWHSCFMSWYLWKESHS